MIELDRATKRYGTKAAVDDMSLSIARGELFVLIGPSGSGKSTALKLINRLIGLSSGTVRIDGQDVRDFEPVKPTMVSASSRTLISLGFPMLTGPLTPGPEFIRRTHPSTRSST